MDPPVLYGAADLRRHDIPSFLETVVIKPPLGAYLERYEMCCERHPEERAHNERQIYREFVTHIFHRRITGDNSAEDTLDMILSPYYLRKPTNVAEAVISMNMSDTIPSYSDPAATEGLVMTEPLLDKN